jgi:MFS family permease
MLTSLFGNMTFTGVNLALPDVASELGLSVSASTWVPLSILLAMAAASVPGARLADIHGRRRTSLIAFLLCLISLGLSAVAWNASVLVFSRAICGIGTAIIFNNNIAMITSAYPPEVRGRVLGYAIGAVYLGLSSGPLVCGLLIQCFGWRSIFWCNFFGYIPPLLLLLKSKKEQQPAGGEPFDRRGAALWAALVLPFFMGLTIIGKWPLGLSLLLGAAVAGALFVHSSLTTDRPVFDLRLFKGNGRLISSALASLCGYSATNAVSLILSLYFQHLKGLSPAQTGLILAVQPIFQTALTPVTGRMSDKTEARLMASTGMLVIGLSLALFGIALSPETGYPIVFMSLALLGIGIAIFIAPNNNVMIGAVPANRTGQVVGLITAVRLCGQVLSGSIATMVFTIRLGTEKLEVAGPADLMPCLSICFYIFFPLCLLGALLSLAQRRQPYQNQI